MKLVLLGYMGCGKSAVSKTLSNQLNTKNIDLDDYIEAKEGVKISEIFATKGEVHFRKLEVLYLKEILRKKTDFILSLGGGTPCFGNNIALINQKATSVYLKANIPTLVERLLPEKQKRPLIARIHNDDLATFIGKHLFERQHFYSQSKVAVSVDKKSVKTIVDEIVNNLK